MSHTVYPSPKHAFLNMFQLFPLISISPFDLPLLQLATKGLHLFQQTPLIMKLTTALPLLSLPLLPPLTLAFPQTRYSTVTIIPYPPYATVIQYHPTGTAKPGLSTAYYNLTTSYRNSSSANNTTLSHTLSYPTTHLLLPPTTHSLFPKPPAPSFPPTPSSPPPCTPGSVKCHNSTSFSLCVPGHGYGHEEDDESKSEFVFMGSVANGTICDENGRTGKVYPVGRVGRLEV